MIVYVVILTIMIQFLNQITTFLRLYIMASLVTILLFIATPVNVWATKDTDYDDFPMTDRCKTNDKWNQDWNDDNWDKDWNNENKKSRRKCYVPPERARYIPSNRVLYVPTGRAHYQPVARTKYKPPQLKTDYQPPVTAHDFTPQNRIAYVPSSRTIFYEPNQFVPFTARVRTIFGSNTPRQTIGNATSLDESSNQGQEATPDQSFTNTNKALVASVIDVPVTAKTGFGIFSLTIIPAGIGGFLTARQAKKRLFFPTTAGLS